MDIQYSKETIPEVDVLIDLFENAGYFPIKDKHDTERIRLMFSGAGIVITAWQGEVLVGVARSLCDFQYCCYLSDLCVRDDYKGNGIGRKLVQITKETAGDRCKLILHSSPNALDFYSVIGMERIDSAFIIPRMY